MSTAPTTPQPASRATTPKTESCTPGKCDKCCPITAALKSPKFLAIIICSFLLAICGGFYVNKKMGIKGTIAFETFVVLLAYVVMKFACPCKAKAAKTE